MRILQINTAVNTGSTGRIAEDIGKVLIEHGHESYIAFGRGDRPSQSKKIKIGTKLDTYKHGIKTLVFDKHGLSSSQATKEFLNKVDEVKPDVVGLHNIHGYYINYKILFEYLKAKQLPVLWTFHDCWPFTGHCTYFDSVDCRKWETHCNNCPKTASYPKALVDRSYNNFEDKKEAFTGLDNLKIITPSHWLANHVKHSFLKNYPVEVIHNGIDLSLFKPDITQYKPEEKIVLGVASTWDKRKGLEDFKTLRKTLPLSTKIVLIGLRKKQIDTLPEGITGISRTENTEELITWYNKASVFVNPTYTDNFPTTNIEALACGTPVITYNTGGSPEAIDNSERSTGMVVEKGNVEKLSMAILSIKKNNAVIDSCRRRAELCFDAKERYLDYLNLYNSYYNDN